MKRTILTFIGALISSVLLNAQSFGTWEGARLFETIGDINTEAYHMNMKVDANNNVYVVGVFKDVSLDLEGTVLANRGSYDVFICSYDPTGALRWARSIGSAGNDDIGGLIIDGNDLYVGGAYTGNDVFFTSSDSLVNSDNYDSFIAHYNANDGTFQSAKRVFWGIQQQRLKRIILDKINNYIVAVGFFRTQLVHGTEPGDIINSQGPKDQFIARFDISGGFESLSLNDIKTYYCDLSTVNFKTTDNSIIGTTHTGYFIGGDLVGKIRFTPTDSLVGIGVTKPDAMLIKVDQNLNFVWARKGGSTGNDHVNSAGSDDDGNIYISGKYEGSITFDSTKTIKSSPTVAFGAQDMYIAKYNREGRLQWLRYYGGIGNDDGFGMAVEEDFIQVAGNVSNSGNPNTGFYKLDKNGNDINQGEIFGDGEDIGKAVGFDSEGQTYIAGYFNSTLLSFGDVDDPDTTLTNSTGTYDGFLGKYQYPLSIVREQVTNVSCAGGSNGYIRVRGEFGVPPYTFAWEHNPGNTTNVASGLSAGTYIVSLTDSDVPAEITRDTIKISSASPIVINRSITHLKCYQDQTGAIDITVSGGTPGYTYLWSLVVPGGNLNPTLADQINLEAGVYKVTVTDKKSCKRDSVFAVNEPGPVMVVVDNATNVSSAGAGDGAISITASGGNPGYSYDWSGPAGYASTDEDITGLDGGTYSVVATDNNLCESSQVKASIEEPGIPWIELNEVMSILCNGDCNGSAVALSGGGVEPYVFSWEHDGGLTDTVATGLCAGWVKVTLTDNNGAGVSVSDSVYMQQPDVLQAFKTTTNAKCYGACDGKIIIDVMGGTDPFTFLWTPTGDTTQSLVNICSGTYSVDVTDANGCIANAAAIVTQPLTPFSFGFSKYVPRCFGTKTGALKVNISTMPAPPLQSLLWSNGLTTDSISLIAAGDYWVVAEDMNGCTDTGYTTLGQPEKLTAVFADNKPACYGLTDGALTATATGGTVPYAYFWTPGALSDSAISGLNPGVYTVRVTDKNGCTDTKPATVGQSQQVVIDLVEIKHILCSDSFGCVDVNVSGGNAPYTYFWSPTADITQDICGKSAGTYQLSVTDNNDCPGLSPNYVIADSSAEIVIQTQEAEDISCFGIPDGKITLLAGTGNGPFMYSIDAGMNFQAETAFPDLPKGSYITVVRDVHGCLKYGDALSVEEPDPTVIGTQTASDISCNGLTDGTITLNATGNSPFEYSIDNGSNFQTETAFAGLSAGSFITVAKDNNGCLQYGDTLSIVEPALLEFLSILVDTATAPTGGSITLIPKGGNGGYLYFLNDVQQSDSIFENLTTGIYQVRVNDLNDCSTGNSQVVLTTGVFDQFGRSLSMQIYPNPSTGQFTIEIENKAGEDLTLEVVNLTGQLVFKQLYKFDGLARFVETLDLSDQPSGTYLMRVNGLTARTKLVIR